MERRRLSTQSTLKRTVLCAAIAWLVILAAAHRPAAAQTPGPAAAVAATAATTRADAFAQSVRPVAVGLRVNGEPVADALLLEVQGQLHATPETIRSWRLRLPPDGASVDYEGQAWVPLSAFSGYTATKDDAQETIDLAFAPEAFDATQLARRGGLANATAPREHALFLNYDATALFTRQRTFASRNDAGALVEAGWTGPWGFATSSHSVRRDAFGSTRVQRLESSFTHDQPDDFLTWRIGDSSTRASLWSQSTYFGGLQVGRNFRLNPSFVSQPVPVLAGSASAPSTLELYLNDVLAQSTQVPAGPFSLEGVTGLTGGGQARLVLRDPLGRESVVVRDFFGDVNLLEAGLTDWSAELGALREGLGSERSEYGRVFAAGLWRGGLSKTRTVETRVEVDGLRQAVGLGLLQTLDGYWFVQGALASSHGEAGAGHRWSVQLNADPVRQRLAARMQGSSRGFRLLGQPVSQPPARLETSVSFAVLAERSHSLRLFAGQLRFDDGTRSTSSGITYSRNLGRGYLYVSASRAQTSVRSGHIVTATWSIPFERTQVAASVSRRDGHLEPLATATRNTFLPEELGWRLASGRRSDAAYAEAGVYQQARHAWLSADISSSSEQQALRLGARGALAFIDGSAFATHRLDDSFALVDLPKQAGIGVRSQGQVRATTDARGRALVPRLAQFSASRIHLDASDLPINAEIDSLEQTVTPGRRSAVRVEFAVRAGRAALLQINFADGEAAPLGAQVTLDGSDEAFVVGNRGAAFVSGMQDENRLTLRWKGASCGLRVTLPAASDEDITRVGPLICAGVPR